MEKPQVEILPGGNFAGMYTPENSEKWLGVSVDLQERLDGGAQTSI